MKPKIVSLCVVGLALVVAGCQKPTSRSRSVQNCSQFFTSMPQVPQDSVQSNKASSASTVAGKGFMFRRLAREVSAKESHKTPSASTGPSSRTQRLNVLVLSGGGKFGAYGAGFLAGWQSVDRTTPDRFPVHLPELDLITGISTGSILSTFVMAASQTGDPAILEDDLPQVYLVDTKDVLREIPLTLAALTSNAIFDPRGRFDEAVRGYVATYIDIVAQASVTKTLLTGLVNMDDGQFYIADFGKIATSKELSDSAKIDCYSEAVLASSAVPFVWPPRFIDGAMYMDGGIRFGAFMGPLIEQIVQDLPQGDRLDVRVIVIVNGDLSPNKDPQCDETGDCKKVKNNLLSVVKRATAKLMVDQIYKDSVYRIGTEIRELDRLNNVDAKVYYTYAPSQEIKDAGCRAEGGSLGVFNKEFQKCLIEIGRRHAVSRPKPLIELNP